VRPGIVILALWLGWLISWLFAALWSNRTEGRPAIGTEIRYRPVSGYDRTVKSHAPVAGVT
jgi:hypothetical protein